MWRGGYNEDWERKKEYLIKTLFQDIPLLSPVPEEEDSHNDSSSRVSPSNYRRRIQTEARQPYSPLPPLIVEREANRHDEPEEYYQRLEQKMRRLYRQLFLEEVSLDSSFEGYGTDETATKFPTDDSWYGTCAIEKNVVDQSLSSNPRMEVDLSGPLDATFVQNKDVDKHYSEEFQNPSSETRIFDEKHNDSNKSSGSKGSNSKIDISITHLESHDENLESEAFNLISEINEESPRLSQTENNINVARNEEYRESITSPSSSVTSDPGGHYQQVTFQAEVHRESSVQDDSSLSLVYEESVPEEDGNQHLDQEVVRLEKTRVSDFVANIRTTSNQLDTNEIETMRTPRDFCIRTSYATLPEQSRVKSNERISPEPTRHSLEDYNPVDKLKSKSSLEVEHSSDDFHKLLQSSTPKTAKKRRMDDQTVSDYTCSTPSSNKRGRYEDVSIQVNAMMEWSSLRGNFFVGTPKMFRLCSCKNHSCTC